MSLFKHVVNIVVVGLLYSSTSSSSLFLVSSSATTTTTASSSSFTSSFVLQGLHLLGGFLLTKENKTMLLKKCPIQHERKNEIASIVGNNVVF